MGYLLLIDTNVSTFLSQLIPHNLFFNTIFSFFSYAGASWIWWILFMALLFIFEEHRNHRFLTYFITGFGFAYVLNELLLKNMFARSRPNMNGVCPVDFSFPSTHAVTAFAAATILSRFDPKRKWLYYFIALLVSYSRLYLGCHYLGDVLIGGLIGWIISQMILKIHLSYSKKNKHVHKK